MERPIIVCLCGSTRFSEAYHQANLAETLAGKIVLSIGCDTKNDTDLLLAGQFTEGDKERLDVLHMRKIELADEILFLNVGGYMGQSTLREHFYASNIGKTIRYLEKPARSNEYYERASTVGMEWLKEQQGAGRFVDGMRLINRRAWFPDDTPAGLAVGWVDIRVRRDFWFKLMCFLRMENDMNCFECHVASQECHLVPIGVDGQVWLCPSCEADVAEMEFQSSIAQYEHDTFVGADDSVLYGTSNCPA